MRFVSEFLSASVFALPPGLPELTAVCGCRDFTGACVLEQLPRPRGPPAGRDPSRLWTPRGETRLTPSVGLALRCQTCQSPLPEQVTVLSKLVFDTVDAAERRGDFLLLGGRGAAGKRRVPYPVSPRLVGLWFWAVPPSVCRIWRCAPGSLSGGLSKEEEGWPRFVIPKALNRRSQGSHRRGLQLRGPFSGI